MMKWMKCRATRLEIDRAEVGEQLNAPTLRHVATCAACLAFQDERARLRELLTSLEPVTAPADFDFRLRARIAAQTESVGPRSFFAGFGLSTPAIAVAALVVVLGGSILWMAQHGTNQTATVAGNPPNQVREGNSPTTDDSKVAIREITPLPTMNGTREPIGPVSGNKGLTNQVKGATYRSNQPGRSTRDFSALGAPSIKRGQNTSDVSVVAPMKPMVLSFQDDNGARRTFSLPPVSFGSQRLLESRVVPVSLKNDRVW